MFEKRAALLAQLTHMVWYFLPTLVVEYSLPSNCHIIIWLKYCSCGVKHQSLIMIINRNHKFCLVSAPANQDGHHTCTKLNIGTHEKLSLKSFCVKLLRKLQSTFFLNCLWIIHYLNLSGIPAPIPPRRWVSLLKVNIGLKFKKPLIWNNWVNCNQILELW